MSTRERTTERIETLRSLMDRLCSEDLMLPEATQLRNRLSDLLAQEDDGPVPAPVLVVRPRPLPVPSPRIEKGRSGKRSPRALPCPCLVG